MKTAAEMLDFVRGRSQERFAASPLFTDVLTQPRFKHDWLGASNEPSTIREIISIGREAGFVPFFEVLWFEVGVIDYEVHDEPHGETMDRVKVFHTPKGDYTLIDRFTRGHSRHVAQRPFSTLADLDAYEYAIRRSLDRVEQCRPRLKAVLQQTGDAAVPYFTGPMPLKCFSLIGSAESILMTMDAPDRMLRLCELNEQLVCAATRIAAEEGFKVFFSGTESSLYSPKMVDEYVIAFLLKRREFIRELDGLFYLHECGRMRDLIARGIYGRLCPDILEGFQSPPSGDVTDMGSAVRDLPASIVTKGDLDLNFFLDAGPAQVKAACLKVLGKLAGRRHLMGGSCSALPGTPIENFRAVVEAVEEANRW